LKEGGFDSGAKNASFSTDIGGKNDPGRLAEQKFQQSASYQPGAAGIPTQTANTDGGQFNALGGDTSA
jgi:hypothetical protein